MPSFARPRWLVLALAAAAVAAPLTPWAQEEGQPSPAPGTAAPEATEAAKPEPNPVVLVKTAMGDIKIRLNRDKAPLSVANFLAYVDDKFYDGTIFHRVVDSRLIQGGAYNPDFTKRQTKPPIKNEAENGLSNQRGTIAMARTNILDSATSQFFINVVDNPYYDHRSPREFGYAVFGEVIEGMDVVDKIAAVKTGPRGPLPADCPLQPISIISVRRVEG